MTCFWQGLINSLDTKDFIKVGYKNKPNEIKYVELLKLNNKLCENVTWQSTILTKQFLQESFEAIKNLNISSIRNGYLCSTCDPFLILVSEIFKVNINHNYNNIIINYTIKNSRKTLNFKSNKSHFF